MFVIFSLPQRLFLATTSGLEYHPPYLNWPTALESTRCLGWLRAGDRAWTDGVRALIAVDHYHTGAGGASKLGYAGSADGS